MPVFTAGAAAIATAIGFTAGTTGFIIAQSLIAAGLAAGAGHLLGVFDEGGLPPVEDPGVEQRLGANTQNRVPILYGQFMQRGSLTYAEISADRQTLYTVITLGEGPITSIDKIFWDDIELTLDAAGEVVSGVDVEGNAVTRLTGQLNVQTYLGTAVANNSTYLEGLVTDWTSNHKMTNLVYAVVTVRYNRDNDVTNLSDMRFIGTAPINSPAEAVIDQLTNVRHGLGLSPTVIDSDSFNAAQVYYQTMLPYTDASGVTRMAERFQVNGSLNSADPVFERIEAILLGSNSSLRWQGGKYSIFINKADTVEAFNMNESRVVGDIQVSEVGLNSVVNSVEVQYGRDPSNNYQRNTVTVDLPTANRYPNELDRVRSIDLPLARTFVEAERIAYILLNQSREQLSIKHMATVEAMPLEAGDVITYTLPNYGWNAKQFRITRVSEMEVEDGLQYQIEAVEYAASVYTDRTHIEPGASPNTSLPDIASIPAVTDLQVIATDTAAAIPAFTLQWTTPPNSRVESFDIFANLVDTDFSSGSTALVNSVRSTSGIYTAGSTVSSQISTVSAGTVTVWVVARNSNANSDPSNAATFLWNPASATSTDNLGYRFHNNVVTIDPGAPTGMDGKGGDWYERGDALDVSNPHWEAVGAGRAFGGSQREVSFTVTGTAASIESTEVDVAQQIRFDLSGTIGEREQVMFARPEVTDFTFSGIAADVAGLQEYWQLGFTGSSDAAVPLESAMEEFYIYLAGSTPSPTTVSFNNTVVTPTTYTAGTDVAVNGYIQVGAGVHGQLIQINMEDSATTVAALNAYFGTTSVSMNQASLQANPIAFTITNPSGDTYTANLTGQNSQNFSINLNSALGGYFMTLSVGDQNNPIPPADRANFPTGTVITWSFPDRAADITASSVQVSIPTETINETFTLTNSLTGSTALRNDLLTSIQAVTAFTDEFTVTADVASGITGVTDGEPIIKLVANDTTDHSISVTFTDGDGDLTGSVFGSLVDGVLNPEDIPTEIRITYDSTLSPSFQDIVIGGAADAAAIAGVVAPMIDSHGELQAVQGTFSSETVNTGGLGNSAETFNMVYGYFGIDNIPYSTDAEQFATWQYLGDAPTTWSEIVGLTLRNHQFASFWDNWNCPEDGNNQILIFIDTDNWAVLEGDVERVSFFIGGGNSTTGFHFEPTGSNTTLTVIDSAGDPPGIDFSFVDTNEPINDVDPPEDGMYFFWQPSTVSTALFSQQGTAESITLTPDNTASTVIVNTIDNGGYSEPVLTIEERGTSAVFTQTISTLQQGQASIDATSMISSFTATYGGVEIASGIVPSRANRFTFASLVSQALNSTAVVNSTVTNNVVTATSVANSGDELNVIIAPGQSDDDTIPTIAVAKVVTQVGNDADVFAGTDAMISPMIGTDGIGTVNAAGMTFAEITAAVAALYTTDGRYTPTAGTSSLLLVSTFAGDSPQTTWTVDPGTEVVEGVAIPATLAADRIVISNGIGISDEGVRSSYVIAVGGTNVVTGTFASAAGQNAAASELVVGLTGVSEYIGSVMDNVATATSVVLGEEDDVTITITAGTNADGTTPTIAVAKAVVEPGERPELDFTNTVWNYFVINQEIRIDGDTVEMGADNTIAVRRGLILDSTSIQGGSYTTAVGTPIIIPTTHTVGNKPATLVVTGGATLGAQASAGGSTVGFTVEYSVDGGTTWLAGQSSDLLQIGAGAGLNGQLLLPTLGGNFAADVAADVTVSFRITKTGTDTNMLILSQFLILEELRAV